MSPVPQPQKGMNLGEETSAWRKTLEWLAPLAGFLLLAAAGYLQWVQDKRFEIPILIVAAGLLLWYTYNWLRVRRVLKQVERERERAWSPQLEAERRLLQQVVPSVGSSASVPRPLDSETSTLYIRGIELENIRCFDRFGLGFETPDGPFLTTILLGDNAAGKSTVLRSIALGLCQESDAIALIKGLPGSFLRKGAERGSILLHVRSTDRKFEGSLHTTIERTPSGELIRQRTTPAAFPWNSIFLCGYGTHRSSGRPSSFERYAAREAVGTLFSDTADLLNPEVVLLRRDEKTRRRLGLILKQILLLEDADKGIVASERGIELDGPWGSQPISAVSDGYRSTSQWVLDYLGWQLFADRLRGNGLEGLLLIDELEQHLHPRWQRYFVQRLRAQFGQTQIIASSHTPLLAAGVADVSRSQVVRLMPAEDGRVETMTIPAEELTGKRADQVLADAFGLITSKSPGSLAKIDRYTELLSSPKRNVREERELSKLKEELKDTWSTGDHELKRKADEAVSKVLDAMITEGEERMIVDAHVRQRLADLFGRSERKS